MDYSSLLGENVETIESLLGTNSEAILSILAFLGGFILVVFLIILAILILLIIATCKMYIKAGKKGWQAIIPYYNSWVLTEIAGLNWWWFFVVVASGIVGIVFGNSIPGLKTVAYLATLFGTFNCNYNIAKKLHKDTAFAVLMTIFPVIMIPIVAFSKSYQFDHNVELSKNGVF